MVLLQGPAQAQNLRDSLVEAKSDIVVKVSYSHEHPQLMLIVFLSFLVIYHSFLLKVSFDVIQLGICKLCASLYSVPFGMYFGTIMSVVQ